MGRKVKFQRFQAAGVQIHDTGTDGKGIGRIGEQVIFVEGAVPGDVAVVDVLGKTKGVLYGVLASLEQASALRAEPVCAHFGDCGGCKWQNMSYAAQLQYKEKQVMDAMVRIGKLEVGAVLPIVQVPVPLHYRNKVEFTFSDRRWYTRTELAGGAEPGDAGGLGFHIARFFDKVVDIHTCYLGLPVINAIRNEVRSFAQAQGISFYNLKHHTGYLRNLMFRNSVGTGELMLILTTGQGDPAPAQAIFQHLEARFPEITSFIHIPSDRKNPTFSGLPMHVWKGPAFITEKLGPWSFRVSPTSFFQTNTLQAKALYDVVREFAGTERVGILYDLYCGAGSIGIYLNDLAQKVVGVEYVEEAVHDARENVQLNGLTHFSFHAGDMRKVLTPEFTAQEGRPDLIVTDPPRAGMDPLVVERLLEMAAPRIIYVSCNAATQARDLALLSRDYDLVRIQPVDMFPQTSHVENVAELRRKSHLS